jgi:hypothetical protein
VILAAISISPALRIAAWWSLAIHAVLAMIIVSDIALGRRQHMTIMNLVWPITALYGGVFALWAYFSFGRAMPQAQMKSHEHMDHAERPMWQASVLGATHCGAGCTLGDVLADGGLFLIGWSALLGSKLLTSCVFDFVAAYLLGIVFQYCAIVPMRKLSPGEGVWAAIKADTLSLIAFQIGMYAWMAISQKLIFDKPPEPNSPVYWFMMQIAMIAGFATSYPMNWWLIRTGIKERM